MKHKSTERLNIMRIITIGLALAICLGGLASIAASAAEKAKGAKADVVYRNGFVYTVDGVRARAEAFAVMDGKFIAVGSNDGMKAVTGKDTKVSRPQRARWSCLAWSTPISTHCAGR